MFEKYCSEIQKLDNFNKEDILTEKFALYNKNNKKGRGGLPNFLKQ